MFNKITDKINSSFKKLRGNSVISSSNVEETLKEIRLSLLEADVNYKVVKELIDKISTIIIRKCFAILGICILILIIRLV